MDAHFYCCHDKFGGLTQCQGAEETGMRFAASTGKGNVVRIIPA
jgi:hypothetical protein